MRGTNFIFKCFASVALLLTSFHAARAEAIYNSATAVERDLHVTVNIHRVLKQEFGSPRIEVTFPEAPNETSPAKLIICDSSFQMVANVKLSGARTHTFNITNSCLTGSFVSFEDSIIPLRLYLAEPSAPPAADKKDAPEKEEFFTRRIRTHPDFDSVIAAENEKANKGRPFGSQKQMTQESTIHSWGVEMPEGTWFGYNSAAPGMVIHSTQRFLDEVEKQLEKHNIRVIQP
jgi:hypothetical protein